MAYNLPAQIVFIVSCNCVRNTAKLHLCYVCIIHRGILLATLAALSSLDEMNEMLASFRASKICPQRFQRMLFDEIRSPVLLSAFETGKKQASKLFYTQKCIVRSHVHIFTFNNASRSLTDLYC